MGGGGYSYHLQHIIQLSKLLCNTKNSVSVKVLFILIPDSIGPIRKPKSLILVPHPLSEFLDPPLKISRVSKDDAGDEVKIKKSNRNCFVFFPVRNFLIHSFHNNNFNIMFTKIAWKRNKCLVYEWQS